MKLIIFFITIMVGLCVLPFIIAEQQTLGVFKQFDCINLKQICSNCTYNYISVIYPNSTTALSETVMTKSGVYYTYELCNKSDALGQYIVQGVGNLDGINQTWTYDYYITPNGESTDTGTSLTYLSLLGLLIVLLGICVLFFLDIPNPLMKVTMVGVGYLLLISIFFVSWQMSLSLLGSADFLSTFLKLMFYITMWGALPILLGFLAWWFIQIIRLKEIRELMERGLPEQDARQKLKEYGKY